MTRKILLAIPAYNCEAQIARTLGELDTPARAAVAEIMVLDNRSTDRTVEVALEFAKEHPDFPTVRVCRNVENVNLGGSHKIAFMYAEKHGFTHVAILHGDNQAHSGEVTRLVDITTSRSGVQTVLGARFARGSRVVGYDWKRRLGNLGLNAIYSVFCLRPVTDLGSGLNLFALRDLDKSRYLAFGDTLSFNHELLLDLIGRKVPFAFAPISWREEDQVSNARNWRIAASALGHLFSGRFRRPVVLRPEEIAAAEHKYQTQEVH